MNFEIIEKKEKKKNYLNQFLFILIVISFLILLINNKKYNNELAENLALILLGVSSTIKVLIILFSYNTHEKIDGEIKGEITFNKDCINYQRKTVLMKNIKNLDFWIIDYKYMTRDDTLPIYLGYYYSNGGKNFVEIELNNGEKTKIYFIQKTENQFLKLKETLIEYHLKNKLSFIKLTEVLKINNFKKIQDFKNSLNENQYKTIGNTV